MKQCYLCSSTVAREKFVFPRYKILVCGKCGIYRRHRELTKTELVEVFSSKYFTKEQKDYFKGQFSQRINLKLPRNQSFLQRLETINELTHEKKGKLLDIGCGSGVFIKLAKEQGWKIEGVDISSYAAKFAREKFGLKIHVGAFETFKPPKNSFDVITSWDVISYSQHPEVIFKKVYQLLKPKGVFAFEVTVVDTLLNYLSYIPYYLSSGAMYEYCSRGLPFEHAYHFTRRTINRYMKQFGFTIVQAENHELDFRFSSIPKAYLPVVNLVSMVAQGLGKTVLYRLYTRKK